MFHRTAARICALSLVWPALGLAQALPQADDAYFRKAAAMLDARLALVPNMGRAKNVILFIGDGMGVTTVTAARIFAGQAAGEDGPSHDLTMDLFPYSALSRTYSSDAQVTDSAPSATAMTTGVKAKNDTLGLDASADYGVCGSGRVLETIAEAAEARGYATGIVSTARITHATPAAMYAHTANRDWEADGDLPEDAKGKCKDIADQLVTWPAGDGFEVMLGGGRANFLPAETADPENEGKTGKRTDKRDLTAEWLNRHGNQKAAYVWNEAGFAAVDPEQTDKLLGLFEMSHMQYEADRAGDKGKEPSLAEMTVKAIDILARNPKGYVMMVEGGRIDHAHHAGNAYRALTDTMAFDAAIKAALGKVDLAETLVIVTADHSHVFTMAGYPKRDNPILGLVREVDGKLALAADGKPYTTLGYQNGPGSVIPGDAKDGTKPDPVDRADLTEVDTTDPAFLQQAALPLGSETHGGDDVVIHAEGPFAHLFSGTVDEQFTFHVMQHALGWDAP